MIGNVIIPEDPLYRKQRFTLDDDNRLVPLLSPKGYEVFNCRKRSTLVEGARKSGKSLAICNRFMRHGYEINGAVVGIIAKTLKNAKQGIWRDLTEFVLPGWVDQGIVKLIEGPKMEPDTKMHWFRISNIHGTTSDFQLHSLPHDELVERVFKGTRFSGIWISEADQFYLRLVMNILLDQLRVITIDYSDHIMLLDANPPEDGEAHWLYNAFFNEPRLDPEVKERRQRIHFEIKDNPFLPEGERLELIENYKYDPIKYQRFVEGKWVQDVTASYFEGFFFPNIHVVGDISSPNPEERTVLMPDENTQCFLGGWDIGATNHAFSLISQRINDNDEPSYDVLEDIVELDSPMTIYDFSEMVMEKIVFWNDYMKSQHGRDVPWRHWGDTSMFDHRASIGMYDAAQIFQASGGKISVKPATKGKDSIMSRIGLTQRLLHSGRLFVSAAACNTIQWLRFLRKGSTKGQKFALNALKYKHGFDSGSYIWASELPIEMFQRDRPVASSVTTITA